jgi:hypothetical protein
MSRRSSRSLDDLRAEHPALGFALYAITPGEPVTLEVHTPDDDVFAFHGPTEQAAIDQAFPPVAPEEPAPTPPPSIFD